MTVPQEAGHPNPCMRNLEFGDLLLPVATSSGAVDGHGGAGHSSLAMQLRRTAN